MRGSVQLADLVIGNLSNLLTEEIVDGGSSPRLIHPSQVPGRFLEFWGYYEGDQATTIRVRKGMTDLEETGEVIFEVELNADHGFFYAATEYEITEQCFLTTTSQMAVGSSNCKLRFTVIQLSCEERPGAVEGEMDNGIFTLSNVGEMEVANDTEHAFFRPNLDSIAGWPNLKISFEGEITSTFESTGGTLRVHLGGVDDPLGSDNFDDGEPEIIEIEILEDVDRAIYSAEVTVPNPGGGMVPVRVRLSGGYSEEGDNPVILHYFTITIQGVP
jgi:hypothetical protein